MATKKAAKKTGTQTKTAAPKKAKTKKTASTSKLPPLDPATQAALASTVTALVTAIFPRAEVMRVGSTTWYLSKEHPYCGIIVRPGEVVLRLPGPDHDDPDGLLRGSGKAGKTLHLRDPAAVPTARIQAWLRARA